MDRSCFMVLIDKQCLSFLFTGIIKTSWSKAIAGSEEERGLFHLLSYSTF